MPEALNLTEIIDDAHERIEAEKVAPDDALVILELEGKWRDERIDTDTASLVVATPQYYDWWAPLPSDQGLTVGNLLELAQAGGAGWAVITGPNAASKLRAALEQP